VFVHIEVCVQYKVTDAANAEKFFYQLSEPREQMQALIFDVIRSLVPKMPLDNVFTSKTELSEAVQAQLKDNFESFGLSIISTPITDIDPSAPVKAAMKYVHAPPRRLSSPARMAPSEAGNLTLPLSSFCLAKSKRWRG
jgi:regulator of protease activity HflC (stomatin/prohibitin superfamily)